MARTTLPPPPETPGSMRIVRRGVPREGFWRSKGSSVRDGRASRVLRVPPLSIALFLVAPAVVACSASAPGRPRAPGRAPLAYYLALGDSLSRGVQPNAAGTNVETAQGYPNLVYARLARGNPVLRLVQLG